MSGLTVTIDYGIITGNVKALVAAAPTAQVMAVVKADAYGHGLVEAGRAARAGGASWLGTAQPSEALALRAGGDEGRVLTWLYGPDVPAAELLGADVDISVSSLEVLATVVAAARAAHKPARVQVCVDTGLGREGATPEDLQELLAALEVAQNDRTVDVVGIWSHLAWADQPGHPTIDAQAARFRAAVALTEERGFPLEVRHLANSACTLTREDLHFDMVRPGIAVYGISPIGDTPGADYGLTPAMSVTTTLALVKDLPEGAGVSYGHEYVTPRATKVGLVSVGYADGVFRAAGGSAQVVVGGELFPIAGRVCMDQFVIDLGPHSAARAGDLVTLIGPDGPSATDWASAIGTINYEVVCRFGGHRPKGRA